MERIERLTRIAVVTAGISVAGGVVGATCAASALTLIAVAEGGARTVATVWPPGLLAAAAGFGAVFGMISAPLFVWGLLRSVALGRAVVYTAVGALVGSLVGELSVPMLRYPAFLPGVVAGAFAGIAAASVLLHLRERRRTAHLAEQAV